MTNPRLIETFNTHRMTAAVIQAVKTARDSELAEIMLSVRRAAEQPRQTPQHLIVYGERGAGKSFLMRLVEIEIERLAREERQAIAAVLLPEEQYNILSAPQLILAIAASVRGAGWEAAAYAVEFRPQAEAWEDAVADLAAALDQRFGEGLGLVVAIVENFDILTRNLFGGGSATQGKTASAKAIEQSTAEQLLRKLMDTQGSRLMLVASATGAVDQDYDRPLFQAFKVVDLQTWIPDDCIAYFNRRRALQQEPALSPTEEARARAIAEFIGGNPRLAQLLGEVLVMPDARSIAEVLNELSDHLADYYRRRIEDLPRQPAALLDAMIRKGEPCTQTELAVRVGAKSQAQIADAFSYLLSSRLLAASPDKSGAGRLYRVRDRLFVHFYRRRYGEPEHAQGLAPIAELLESFFTQRERERQARRCLETGELADARLYALNSPFLSEPTDGFCLYRDGGLCGEPSVLLSWAGLSSEETVQAQGELKNTPGGSVKRWSDIAQNTSDGLTRTAALLLKAQALSRCQMDNEAEDTLKNALRLAEADQDKNSQIFILDAMAIFAFSRQKNQETALQLSAKIDSLAAGQLSANLADVALRLQSLSHKARRLNAIDAHELAVQAAQAAYELSATLGDKVAQVEMLRLIGCLLGKLGRTDESSSAFESAFGIAKESGQTEKLMGVLNAQFIFLEEKRPEQTLFFARETIAESSEILSVESLWVARWDFFAAASQAPAFDLMEIFEASLIDTATDTDAKPLNGMLREVVAAVAFNDAWEEFVACLLRHKQTLPVLKLPDSFVDIGWVWSRQVKANGRAQTYARVAPKFPAILTAAELLAPANKEMEADIHLRGLIHGLVNWCDDAGFLRDIAESLLSELHKKKAHGIQAAQQQPSKGNMEGAILGAIAGRVVTGSPVGAVVGGLLGAEIQRMNTIAEVRAVPDKEKILQRLDPDLALAIRRILGLPQPRDLLTQQQGRRKGR